MTHPDLVLRSRRVVARGDVAPAAVHVRGGRIERVAAYDDVPPGVALVDAGSDAILPGVVDTHVHVNEPGRSEWEGFETATRAAAAGGVTTLVDMPLNSVPATTSVAALDVKAAATEARVWVDVGLWGGAVPGNTRELVPLLRHGALGFKCFLLDSGVAEFPYVTTEDLRAALYALRDEPAGLMVHAELAGPLDAARHGCLGPGAGPARRYADYLASRPNAAEDEAIALLVALARETGTRVHVVHLSSASALDTLRRARDARVPITAETTPHYLRLVAEDVPDGATQFKCAPPIRDQANREALWKGLEEGLIGMVVSDHSPCPPELKRLDTGDFDAAWGGISSLQLSLSVVWSEARRRGHSLSRLVEWMCTAPARHAGLAGRKGAIAPGHDADLVVFDPDAVFPVRGAALEHRHKLTPYEAQTLHGVVRGTWVRGERVFEHGAFAPRPRGAWRKGG